MDNYWPCLHVLFPPIEMMSYFPNQNLSTQSPNAIQKQLETDYAISCELHLSIDSDKSFINYVIVINAMKTPQNMHLPSIHAFTLRSLLMETLSVS